MRRGSRRSITIAAAGLALALAATGCGGSDKKASDTTGTTEASKPVGKPTPGGELSMAIESESAGGYCLPTAQLASAGILVANQVYDGLFAYNAKHEPVPYLAETASWNDAHTALTLKLRSGIKFHNGAPLDSAIVKLNLDVLRGEPTATAKTGQSPLLTTFVFADIASVDAPDAQTVVINTKRAWPALPEFLANGRYGIIAEEQLMAGPKCAEKLIGTGPFKLISWERNVAMKLEKNPNYWRKDADGVQLPYLDKLNFLPIDGNTKRFDALAGGTVQAAQMNNQAQFDQIQKDGRFGLEKQPEGYAEVSYGMVNSGKAPLNDLEVRRHLGMAIDSSALNDINSAGKWRAAIQPFDTKVIGHLPDDELKDDPNLKFPKFNTDEAAKFFKGKNITIKLNYATDATTKAIAEEVKAELGDVGVNVVINEMDQSTLINKALGGDFDINLWRNHPGADPDTQYDWWHSGSPVNFGKINDPDIDRLLDAGRIEPDPAKRKAIYEDLNRAFIKGAYNDWNWYSQWAMGYTKNVHGISSTTMPDGSPGMGIWLGWEHLASAWISK